MTDQVSLVGDRSATKGHVGTGTTLSCSSIPLFSSTFSFVTMDSDCLACSSSYLQGNIKKRLVVCCDGTFSGLDKGTDQYSSNVARLSRVISRVGIDTKGEKVPQIVYYQSGVGTGSLTTVNKSLQGESLSFNSITMCTNRYQVPLARV
jgi:hypothetical protein